MMKNIFVLFLGLIVIILGIFIWKKRVIMVVSRHSNVREEDIKAFTKMTGLSTIGIGISLFGMGIFFILNIFNIGIIVFIIFFVISMVIYFIAQQKYNY